MSQLVCDREVVPGPGGPGRPGRGRRWMLLIALALGVGACVAGLFTRAANWFPARSAAPSAVTSQAAASGEVTGLVHIAPSTDRVSGSLAFPEVNGLADGLGRVWLTGGNSGQNHVVFAVDPSGSRIVGRVDLPSRLVMNPNDVAVGPGGVWAAVGVSIYRIAPPRTGKAGEAPGVFAALPPDGLVGDLVVAAGSVWAADTINGRVYRFAASTGRLQAVVKVGTTAGAMAVGNGGVWVADGDAHTVSRISVTHNRVDSVRAVPGVPGGIAASAAGVWVTDGAAGVVTFLDGAARRSIAVPVSGEPTGVAAYGDAVWVADTARGTLSRIDARRHAVVATVPVGLRPYAVAADGRGVWVTVLGKPVVMHVAGGTSSTGGRRAGWQTWLERLCGQAW